MTEGEAYLKLETPLERQEFKCAMNLYCFAFQTLSEYHRRDVGNAEAKVLNAMVMACAYVRNIEWMRDILSRKTGRCVTEDEAVTRWGKYYARISANGIRPPMFYDNGINRETPIGFESFHAIVLGCRKAGMEILERMKTAKKELQ